MALVINWLNMMVSVCRRFVCSCAHMLVENRILLNKALCLCLLLIPSIAAAQLVNSETVVDSQVVTSYKNKQLSDSEFDNSSDPFTLYWQDVDEEYQDTAFGELVYNEPSISTKLEMLRLLSKETPSLVVFMHALSMGLSVDEMLLASLEYQPEKARNLASAAVTILPLLAPTDAYQYSHYSLDALKRYVDGQVEERNKGYVNKGDEHKPYSVQEVVNKFFDNRLVLAPYPDWLNGQFHFMASAQELKTLHKSSAASNLYTSADAQSTDDRPIFVSLYEHNKKVVVNGIERINNALWQNSDVQLPVVFVYNNTRERTIDGLGYPATLKGLRDAYVEQGLMVTPAPEWHTGENHSLIKTKEFYDFFDIPDESDFELEAWNALLSEAKKYDVNKTSILVVLLPVKNKTNKPSQANVLLDGSEYAAWDNPRTESQFRYTPLKGSKKTNLNSLLAQGMVINRPDLIAALNALGVTQIPVSVYYLDEARVKPYTRGPRSLIQAAIGVENPSVVPPAGGILSPSVQLPPASPPGLP